MPTWRSRSRLRAAAIAALLLLIIVSMLATGSTAPPSPANGSIGPPIVPSSNAGTGMAQPDGDAGGPTPPAGDALVSSMPASDDRVQALADEPGGWTNWPGSAWWNAASDGGQDGTPTSGDDPEAPNGNGPGAPMLGWTLDGGPPAFAGGGASGGPGGPGPGNSNCALNAGPTNECVLQQPKDVMPEMASLPLDALSDLMPTSMSDSQDAPDTPNDPSRLRETAANVPEPPAWLLGAVALLAAAASAVAERQRRLGAPVR